MSINIIENAVRGFFSCKRPDPATGKTPEDCLLFRGWV